MAFMERAAIAVALLQDHRDRSVVVQRDRERALGRIDARVEHRLCD